MRWSWLKSGLRFGLVNGNPYPVGAEHWPGTPYNVAYVPSNHPSIYGCGTFRCNNAFDDEDPSHMFGYKWSSVQANLFPGVGQKEWTIALLMNSYRNDTSVRTVFGIDRIPGSGGYYTRFHVVPHATFRALYWYIVASGMTCSVTPNIYKSNNDITTEFPVVLTMNTNESRRRMYVNGVLENEAAVGLVDWWNTSDLTLGCASDRTPKGCNDGNYATFLICDFEWNAKQVLDWSNNPLGWSKPDPILYFEGLGHVPCLHASIGMQSRVGVSSKLQSRLDLNAELGSSIGVDAHGQDRIHTNVNVQSRISATVGLCNKED